MYIIIHFSEKINTMSIKQMFFSNGKVTIYCNKKNDEE